MESSISMTVSGKYIIEDIEFSTYSAAAMGKQLTREQLLTLKQPITTIDLYVSFGEILTP